MKLNNFIGGEYSAPLSNQYLDGYSPITGQIHCQLADSGQTDIDAAVAAAKSAYPAWASTSSAVRAQYLHRIADIIESKADEFADAESRDQGKPLWLAQKIEVPRAVENFRFFANAILNDSQKAYAMDDHAINYTTRSPIGVAGLISPWNLPLYLLTWKIAPALATGNTAVCKPSELTSLTASMLGAVFIEAGLPPGVCNIVLGLGSKAGAALVSHKDVALISFTGGTKTAENIASVAAPQFKKLSLELGGKNPNIIFADADMDACLDTTVRSSFQNQGEICLCGSRILVEEKIYAEFLEKFKARAEALQVGNPLDPNTKMGALVSEDHLEKVLSYVELARDEGGTVISGGKRLTLDKPYDQGYYMSPTIITGLSPECRVMQEEIFGPVVTVTPFKTQEEAISIANGTAYGLSATIWTQNISVAHKTAQSLHTGQVWINTWMKRDLRVPFGGIKNSGMGREGGEYSIDFYTELKNICVNTGE